MQAGGPNRVILSGDGRAFDSRLADIRAQRVKAARGDACEWGVAKYLLQT